MNTDPGSTPIGTLHFEVPLDDAEHLLTGTATINRGSNPLDSMPTVKKDVPLFAGDTFRVGRDASNDLVISGRVVSRFHSVFSASPSGIVLMDLGSTNGTFINSQAVQFPTAISSGDTIEIGNIKVNLTISGESAGDFDLTVTKPQHKSWKPVEMTLLVADIAGYTAISKKAPPDDLANMLDLWLKETSAQVLKHGGEVDKYIGDCVMALWQGTSGDAATVASTCMRAALEIKQHTEELVQQGVWGHQAQHPWVCRITLHSGSALMGTVGAGGARAQTVVGDTVNTAFRLDRLGSILGQRLVVSASTARLLQSEYPLEEINVEHIDVPGLSERVIYTLGQ